MLDLGPHASFIIAAYGVTLVAVAGLVLATIGDDMKQRHLLAELERQGIRRRSAAKLAPRTAAKPTAKAKTPTKKPAAARKTAKPRARKTPS
jgi:heme exporter protein D